MAQVRQRPQGDLPPKFAYCPECGDLVIEGAMGGPARCVYRLSRRSVSSAEAFVLQRHGHVVYNIFRRDVLPGLLAADWFGPKPPKKGRLYTEHDCRWWR